LLSYSYQNSQIMEFRQFLFYQKVNNNKFPIEVVIIFNDKYLPIFISIKIQTHLHWIFIYYDNCKWGTYFLSNFFYVYYYCKFKFFIVSKTIFFCFLSFIKKILNYFYDQLKIIIYNNNSYTDKSHWYISILCELTSYFSKKNTS